MTDNQQRQTGSPSRAQFDDQARTAETDLGGTSQPGRDIPLSCPGCGGKPGIGTRFSLSGTDKSALRSFIEERRQRLLKSIGISHTPNSADVSLQQMSVCDKCRRNFYKEKEASDAQNSSYGVSGTIVLSIPRVASTHAKCVFGHNSFSLLRVPPALRFKVLVCHRIYVPPDGRICRDHLEEGVWANITANINAYTPTQIQEMVDLFINNYRGPPFLDFEYIEAMGDKAVQDWTGLDIAQFNELFLALPSLRNEEKIRPKTALGLWLTKHRTGETNERIATLVDLSRSMCEHLMAKARNALASEWVPLHLGFSRINREDLKLHMTAETRELFCAQDVDTIAIVLDGTYVYIQKSSNFLFQRKNFSGHKHRPLLKPMMVVSPDGHIIDCIGPFEANHNDAAIAKHIGETLMTIMRRGDVVLVDRGFRDAVDHLTALGLEVRMPDLRCGNKPLTTEQANRTRLITSCRYIVEVRNGHLKQCFRQFDKVWPNQSIRHMMIDFRIACAILNVYHPVIHTADGLEKATLMKSRLNQPNPLAALVAAENLNRKSASWESIDGSSNDNLEFPQLTEADLRLITLGHYQLRHAQSYYAEHVKATGAYEVQVCRHQGPLSRSHGHTADDPMLIRGKIQSRFRSSAQHFVYILIDRAEEGIDSVSSYTCSCAQGLRTVGCCAHIATVLWYLGYARHLPEIPIPADFLNDVCVELDEG